jgi:hypothetical protein
VLSSRKNKLNDFNGLQSHTTGSIPVSPTISTKIKYVRNNKDLACKLLKLLSYLKPSIRFWSDFTPKLFRKIRSKTPPKSIKVSSKCLVKFTRADRDRPEGSQEISIGLTGLCLFLLALLCVFAYNVLINKRKWLGDYLMKLTNIKLSLDEAQSFVSENHRHSQPLKRHKFSIGAVDQKDSNSLGFDVNSLLGVATVDVPSSKWNRRRDHVEIRRLCTKGGKDVASFLLGKAKAACFAMGYKCVITYTRPHESGISLKASGFWMQKATFTTDKKTGKITDGLVQWIAVDGMQPDQADRDFTNDVLNKLKGAA